MRSSEGLTEKHKLQVLFGAIAKQFKIPAALISVTIGNSIAQMTEEDAANTNDVIRKWAVWSGKDTAPALSESGNR